MDKSEQEIELRNLREVEGLRRTLDEAWAEVKRLRRENSDLAFAMSVLRREVIAQIQEEA